MNLIKTKECPFSIRLVAASVSLLILFFSDNTYSKTSEKLSQKINLSQVRKVGENDCAYKNLTKAYESIGYQLDFTILPAKRALIESNSGRTDGETARVQYLEKRYPNLVRIPVAICHMHQSFLALKSNNKINSTNLEDLTLGIINGGVFVEKQYTQYNPVRAINNKQ